MDAITRAAPPPGSAQAGDLYVDLQSRTLWLGVDPAVDPAAFVLISDIVALQAEDADIRADSIAYADSKLLLKAPLASPVFTGDPRAPTPAAADNDTSIATTAFVKTAVAAIGASSFVRGMIMEWWGQLAEIGVGPLAGWALCDGSNGTPNLRDKFVIGAGNLAVGSVNPVTSLTTTGGGGHAHAVNHHNLTIAEMPYHDHYAVTVGMSANHAHYVSGSVDAAGAHVHDIQAATASGTSSYGVKIEQRNVISAGGYVYAAGNHTHGVNFWSGVASADHTHQVYGQGSGAGHDHTITGGTGNHEHTVSATQLRDTTPYFALAYIMKL